MLLGDTVVKSVHVLLDESISERPADYFLEFHEATVKSDPEVRRVSNLDWCVGQHLVDEGLLYKITMVVVLRGLIVGFCALVAAGRQQVEDKTLVNIAHVQRSSCGGCERNLLVTTVTQVVVSQRWVPQPEPEAPSEKGRSTSAEPASVSNRDGTKPKGIKFSGSIRSLN